MRTRTLLLLAVTCGLAILVAGGLQLLRISNQEPSTALRVGDQGRAGDALVTVVGFEERDGFARVTVRLSGVDDPEGLDSFRLQTLDDLVAPEARVSTCTGFTVEEVECLVAFPAGALRGDDRQLVLRRADEQVRWVLR